MSEKEEEINIKIETNNKKEEQSNLKNGEEELEDNDSKSLILAPYNSFISQEIEMFFVIWVRIIHLLQLLWITRI